MAQPNEVGNKMAFTSIQWLLITWNTAKEGNYSSKVGAYCKSFTAWCPIYGGEHSSSEYPKNMGSLKCGQIPSWFTTGSSLR